MTIWLGGFKLEAKENAAMEWARWMENTFPPVPEKTYASVLKPGLMCVKVWQLSFRPDYGISGYSDPDSCMSLMELILCTGLLGLFYLTSRVSRMSSLPFKVLIVDHHSFTEISNRSIITRCGSLGIDGSRQRFLIR